MPQGQGKMFEQAEVYFATGVVDRVSGSWRMILCSDPVSALTPEESNPAKGSTNINEVTAGGGYTANGIALTLDNSVANGVFIMKLDLSAHPNGILGWSKESGSPTNIRTAVLIDDDATSPADAAVKYWDLTPDGSTPLSLVAVDINLIANDFGVLGALLRSRVVNP